jgi:adenine phosphoribosyltransferase
VTDPSRLESLAQKVRAIPDFPKPGILFRDIMPILGDPQAMQEAVEAHLEAVADVRDQIDRVVAIESRGFLFGPILAMRLGVGFGPVRKPGKLPGAVVREEYELEYGTDAIEMHPDSVGQGTGVLVVDDLLATGGTAQATCKLVDRLGGKVVGCLFLIELDALKGRARLEQAGHRVDALIHYS